VPLAAVLWNGGISFGGVMAFVFADLLILPILAIYRRYYGTKAMLVIAGTFYLAMALAGYVVEVLFGLLHLVPAERSAPCSTRGSRGTTRRGSTSCSSPWRWPCSSSSSARAAGRCSR